MKNNFTGSEIVELPCLEYLLEKHKMTYWKKNFRMTQFFNQAFVVLDNKKDWSGKDQEEDVYGEMIPILYGGFAPPASIS